MKTRFLPCNSEFFKGWYFRRLRAPVSDYRYRCEGRPDGVIAGLADMEIPLRFKSVTEFKVFAKSNPPSKYRTLLKSIH